MTMIIQKSAINDDILDHDGRRTTPCPYSGFPCCLSPHTGCPKKMLIPLFWNTLYIPVYAGLDHVGRHGLESLVQMIGELWVRPVQVPDKVL